MSKFIKRDILKNKPATTVGFGKIFTDYMYERECRSGVWSEGVIKPFDELALLPCASVLHYGQAAFEGLKAYRDERGVTRLFRARDNFARLNSSGGRLSMPKLDVDECYNALCELVDIERDWIPTERGTSLYIRPLLFACDNSLGVHAATDYKFIIMLSPSGAYYVRGFAPVSLRVEREYVRACKGGTGAYKVIGNYAASIRAGELAVQAGYDQVLWLDAEKRRYASEVGAMNIFFVLGGKIITPELDGTILPGITRDSAIKLLKHMGYVVEERQIDIGEVIDGAKSGRLTEIFGTGTAAVVSPVDRLGDNGVDYTIGERGKAGEVAAMLFNALTDIQTGRAEDLFGWVTVIEKNNGVKSCNSSILSNN